MYYIYHIPNVKIGCTDEEEPSVRVKKQGYSDFEILEEHKDIYIASKRERELQKEYGYRVDSVPYFISRKNWGSKAGKIGGNTYSELRLKKASETGKKTWKENFKDTVKKRRSYKGEGNHKCKITEEKAQQILDDYTRLVNEGHRTYGLYPAVHKLHQDTTFRIVKKICTRETWTHLKPSI